MLGIFSLVYGSITRDVASLRWVGAGFFVSLSFCLSGQNYSGKNFGVPNYSGKKSEIRIGSVKNITFTEKIAAGNSLAIRNAKPYRINCFQT